MNSLVHPSHPALSHRPTVGADPTAVPAVTRVTIVATAAILAGRFPIGFSIVVVFLFAGLHNWLEARSFMTRMPARWGRLRAFFTLGLCGVVGLAAAMSSLLWIAAACGATRETWCVLLATWNSALVLWVASLATIRRRQHPRRQWPWRWPTAFGLMAIAWLWPMGWGVGLVYLHPSSSRHFSIIGPDKT